MEEEEKAGAAAIERFKRTASNYLLKRRRRAAARKKRTGRKTMFALAFILVSLIAAFGWAQSYLVPSAVGREITLDTVRVLASEDRIPKATFMDEDNRLVGTFSAAPPEKPAKDESEDPANKRHQEDARGRDRGRPSDPGEAIASEPDERQGDASKDKSNESLKPGDIESPVTPKGAGTFWAAYPKSDAAFGPLFEQLTRAGSEVAVDPQTSKAIVRVVSTYLIPLLILAAFFGLLFAGRSSSTGIGQVMSFGTIGAKKRQRGMANAVSFDDVGGAEEAVAELSEVVDYLQNPARYEEIGAIPPKGVLLFGPPGCGKTLLAKAVAGEAGVPFFSVAGAEFVESLVGVGAARVRDLFQRVRAVAPAIVFIDELDAAGRRRGSGGSSGGSDEREQTLNQLLVEMDGFEVGTGIVVIGATNRPDILDPALMRPGRFDRHITVDQPDAEGRERILELHARGRPIDDSVDFAYLARRTPGFSGADLANVINEGTLLSLRERKPTVEIEELQEAIQRVLHGPKRRGRVMTDEERSRTAFHESGHAIVAAALGGADQIHRVTILLRARSLGSTSIEREADALILTRTDLYRQLIKAMGGIAAEELVFGEPSTGSEQDIELATSIAKDIIGRYGMSASLGRTRLLVSDVDVFLGSDAGMSNVATSTHECFDQEVRRLIECAESDARTLLLDAESKLDEMAKRLMAEETLEGIPLAEILRGVEVAVAKVKSPFPPIQKRSGSRAEERAAG